MTSPQAHRGLQYVNPETGDQVRIMEEPPRVYSTDLTQKHFNRYYYRYKPPALADGDSHITIAQAE